jgi:hypothetical protein
MLREDLQSLPPHVMTVLVAAANALGNKALTPESLQEIAGQFADSVGDHKARIEHQPRPPKGTKPRLKAVYTLSILGPRIDGRWGFSPGQLTELLCKFRNDGVA